MTITWARRRGTARGLTAQASGGDPLSHLLAELAPSARGEMIHAILEAPGDALAVVGADGVLLDVNTQLASLADMDDRRLLGMPLAELLPHGQRRALTAQLRASHMEAGRRFRSAVLQRSGQVVPVDIRITPVVAAEAAQPLRVVAFRVLPAREERTAAQEWLKQLSPVVPAVLGIIASRDAHDVRLQGCLAAQLLADATAALLLERDRDDLVQTSAVGALPGTELLRFPLGVRSAPVEVWTSGQRQRLSGAAAAHALQLFGAATAFVLEPVRHEETSHGVLVLAWRAGFTERVEQCRGALSGLCTGLALVLSREEELRTWRQQALSDPLTALANRRAFSASLSSLLRRAEQGHQDLALLIADLDGFKRVNDTYGHHRGDALLVELALRWASALRPLDLLARLGGDEFGILLPSTGEEQAREIASRLGDLCPPAVTASFGIALREEGDTVDALVRRADQALYRAKRRRRG